MSRELNEELERGRNAAKALVQHAEDMGSPAMSVIPVQHVNREGALQEWKVTVLLVSSIKP